MPKKEPTRAQAFKEMNRAIAMLEKQEKRLDEFVEAEKQFKEAVNKVSRLPLSSYPLVQASLHGFRDVLDWMRAMRKTHNSLKREIKRAGTAIFDTNVDWKAVNESLRQQSRLFVQIASIQAKLTDRFRSSNRTLKLAVRQQAEGIKKGTPAKRPAIK
jgi:hypothetical protein